MTEELYSIQAKPAIYKGLQLRSTKEAHVAAALERIGLTVDKDHYEQRRLADERNLYTPDFGPYEIGVLGVPKIEVAELYVEARPKHQDGFKRKNEQDAATLALSIPEALLIFVGLKEFPAALFGWCYGARHKPALGVIGVRRDNYSGHQQPCLFLDDYALAWIDGFLAKAS